MDAHLLEPLGEILRHHFEAGDPDSPNKIQEQTHVDALSRLFAAIVSADYDAYAAELAEDVQLELLVPPEFPFVRRAASRQEAVALATHNFGALVDQVPEIVSLTAQGDTVVMEGHESGRVRHSGQRYHIRFVYHFTLRDGKVARARLYSSHADWAALPCA